MESNDPGNSLLKGIRTHVPYGKSSWLAIGAVYDRSDLLTSGYGTLVALIFGGLRHQMVVLALVLIFPSGKRALNGRETGASLLPREP